MSKYNETIEQFVSVALRSDNARRQYAATIREWFQSIETYDPDPLNPTYATVWRFISEQKARRGQQSRYRDDTGVTWETIQRKLTILKKFYKHACALKLSTENPFELADLQFKNQESDPKRTTELVPFERVEELLKLPGNCKKGKRDRAILSLLFGLGLRSAEVRQLKLRDYITIHQETPFLRLLKTKTKYREVALSPWVQDDLEAVLKQRLDEGALRDSYFFVPYRGEKIKFPLEKIIPEKTFYRNFKKYSDQFPELEFVTPHSARVTLISTLIEDDCKLREIQEVSGHASIQSVENYYRRFKGVSEQVSKKVSYNKKITCKVA